MTQHTEPLKDAAVTGSIIGAFYAVYDALGYGFLESVYRAALAIEFGKRGLAFTREEPVEVFYDGQKAGVYRSDFIIESRVVVEVKASRAIGEADHKQLLNYLRATRLELGLMLHFGPNARFHRYIFENARKPIPTVLLSS